MSGSASRRFRVSISWRTMRSSSALDRASPIDFTRSKNSFDCPNPPCEPIASSRPIVFNCSIGVAFASLLTSPALGFLGFGNWGLRLGSQALKIQLPNPEKNKQKKKLSFFFFCFLFLWVFVRCKQLDRWEAFSRSRCARKERGGVSRVLAHGVVLRATGCRRSRSLTEAR